MSWESSRHVDSPRSGLELAAELHCSVASLYKIAPSKDSLVLLAIGRWQARTFANLELRAEQGTTASERARFYFIARGGEPPSALARPSSRRSAFRVDAILVVGKCLMPLCRPLRRVGCDCAGSSQVRPINRGVLGRDASGARTGDRRCASTGRRRAVERRGDVGDRPHHLGWNRHEVGPQMGVLGHATRSSGGVPQ